MAEQSKETQYLTVGLVALSILLWLFWLNQITLFPGRIIQGPEIEQYAYVAATFLGIIAGITAVGLLVSCFRTSMRIAYPVIGASALGLSACGWSIWFWWLIISNYANCDQAPCH